MGNLLYPYRTHEFSHEPLPTLDPVLDALSGGTNEAERIRREAAGAAFRASLDQVEPNDELQIEGDA